MCHLFYNLKNSCRFKNIIYSLNQREMVQKIIKSTLLAFFFICKLTSQVVNYGDLYVMQNTPVKTFFNFQNTATGDLLQDGSFYVNANLKTKVWCDIMWLKMEPLFFQETKLK